MLPIVYSYFNVFATTSCNLLTISTFLKSICRFDFSDHRVDDYVIAMISTTFIVIFLISKSHLPFDHRFPQNVLLFVST